MKANLINLNIKTYNKVLYRMLTATFILVLLRNFTPQFTALVAPLEMAVENVFNGEWLDYLNEQK